MGNLADFGFQAASNLLGMGMGMIAGRAADKRQLRQQEKLQKLQIQGSKELSDYQYAKQLQMWKDTNYGAQVNELKKAGLNPGLMYGMGGQGGMTTGGGAASVAGAQAATGGGEEVTGMGLQIGMMAAQKRLLESQAAKNEAETEKTKGVDTQEGQTRILSLTQGIENAKATEALTKIETELKNITKEIQGKTVHEQQEYIAKQSELASEQLELMNRQNIINKATQYEKIGIIQAELIGAGLENDIKRKGLQVSDAEMQKWKTELAQGWKNLDIQDKELARKQVETSIRKFEAEVKAAYPSIGEVIGNAANNALERAKEMIDGGKEYRPHKVK